MESMKYNMVVTNEDLRNIANGLKNTGKPLNLKEVLGFAIMQSELNCLINNPFTILFNELLNKRMDLINKIHDIDEYNFNKSGLELREGFNIADGGV